jgi:hypothetical protein
MSAPASLSSPTAAPTGAEADRATPSTLLLLFIIRMLILWAEGVATSLRQRTEATDLPDLMRAFGTTDTALLLARFTVGLQRLRALEAEILAGPPNLTTDKQRKPTGAIASPRIPSAPEPPTLTPPTVPTSRPSGAPPHRSAPPAHPAPPRSPEKSQRGQSILSHMEGHGRPRRADSPPLQRDEIRLSHPSTSGPT